MASIRCPEGQARPSACLDWSSGTRDEFHQLVPPCAMAFHAHLTAWRRDGKPRRARRCTGDQPCPGPTPEERRFFLLVDRHTSALQGVHGRLGGMGQSQATQGLHGLWPARLAARLAARPLRAPSRPWRRGAAAAPAPVGVPREEAPAPVVPGPAAAAASPLVPMTAPHGASAAPKTRLHRPPVRAVRNRTTRSTRACASMPASCSSGCAPPTAAACLRRALPTRRPRPGPHGVGCSRLAASWRARVRRGSSSCRPRSQAARRSR